MRDKYFLIDSLVMDPNSEDCDQCDCTNYHNETTPSSGLAPLMLQVPALKSLNILIALCGISLIVIS